MHVLCCPLQLVHWCLGQAVHCVVQSLVHTDKSALLRLEGEVGGVGRSSCMDKKHLEQGGGRGAQNPPQGGWNTQTSRGIRHCASYQKQRNTFLVAPGMQIPEGSIQHRCVCIHLAVYSRPYLQYIAQLTNVSKAGLLRSVLSQEHRAIKLIFHDWINELTVYIWSLRLSKVLTLE